uniref:Uncharacterized protein n=1 Tax=Corvus moneduloides TaxID=1196302 RepID=A0A8U7MI24_CORMO
MMHSKPGPKRVWLAQQPLGSRAGLPAWQTRALLRSCRKSGQELGSKWDFPAWGTPAACVRGGRRDWSGHGAKRVRLRWSIWGCVGLVVVVVGHWDGCPGSHGVLHHGDTQRPAGDAGPDGEVSRLSVRLLGRGSRKETGTAGARHREEAKPWLRSGKRIKKTRKYDIITTPAERVEMAPLNEEDDEDEDSTVFDVKYR